MTLPDLPEASGITWRSATVDDVDALARLTLAVHAVEQLDHVSGPDLFRWIFAQTDLEPVTDYRVAVTSDGDIVADGGAWKQISDAGARSFVWAEARPGHEHLRPGLIAWAKARATQQLAARPEGTQGSIRYVIEAHRTAARADVEAAGFSLSRSFVVMERNLETLPEPGPLPEGVEVIGWDQEHDEGARLCTNEAFADHWGSLPQSPEQWRDIVTGSASFRPDFTFLAVADGRVVGSCLCEVDAEDNATREVPEVFINRVATVRDFRRLGLASHLLVRSLQAARSAGFTMASLDVDETSHTSATEVYRRLGFTDRSRSIHYYLEV